MLREHYYILFNIVLQYETGEIRRWRLLQGVMSLLLHRLLSLFLFACSCPWKCFFFRQWGRTKWKQVKTQKPVGYVLYHTYPVTTRHLKRAVWDETVAENTTSIADSICRVVELHASAPAAWSSDGVAYPKLTWLTADLLPKLVRWATECRSSEFRSTLSLLPVEKYSLTYQQLKEKYKAMVKVKLSWVIFQLLVMI